MGAEQSVEDQGQTLPSDDESVTVTSDMHGYRIMKVFPGSPAHRASLQPYDDMILTLNSHPVSSSAPSLGDILREYESREVILGVWSVIDSTLRSVTLVPTRWNGPGLLGAAVRWEKMKGAADAVSHVIDVMMGGPAEEAGLVPGSDWIVGTQAEAFRRDEQLRKLIDDAATKQATVSLMVYSSATGRVRQVEIAPNDNWGGSGVLGCELATGLLHRIPSRTPK